MTLVHIIASALLVTTIVVRTTYWPPSTLQPFYAEATDINPHVSNECIVADDNRCRSSSRGLPVPPSCSLILRKTPHGHGRTLGIFAGSELSRGMALTKSGDLALHLVDVDPHFHNNNSSSQLQKWHSHGYIVNSITSGYGGNYEGMGQVLTVLPGIGMLAASAGDVDTDTLLTQTMTITSLDNTPNIWASIPSTDEADHPRYSSPLAGSFALNYNMTFVLTRNIQRGEELRADRMGYFRRQAQQQHQQPLHHGDMPLYHQLMDVQQLYQYGTCIDSIIYPSNSKEFGRGAFASKFIKKDTVVAYAPVLPVPREELRFLIHKDWKRLSTQEYESNRGVSGGEDGETTKILNTTVAAIKQSGIPLPEFKWREQLLLNYCLGHLNSTVLLFPYGQFVNYINHAPSSTRQSTSEDEILDGDSKLANVRIQWSERFSQKDRANNDGRGDDEVDPRTMTPSVLWARPRPDGLVMEYVALRDIRPDEEILLDYGSEWSTAWESHVKQWKADPMNNDKRMESGHHSISDYSPAYIMEDVVVNLRTAEEQLQFPYPSNVFTACFYRYENNIKKQSAQPHSSSQKSLNEAVPWKMSRGLFDMVNLRPCNVVARETAIDRYTNRQGQPQKTIMYTAIIRNRPGLSENEQIPKGEKHIVSGIPREAIRFIDRPYTSDEHLAGAFRHNIGLEETGIFPKSWLDLMN